MLPRRWISPLCNSLGTPEFDPYTEQTKRNKEPRNAERDRLQLANRQAVAGDGRIRTEKLSPVTPDVGAAEQIDDEKQRSGDSQCRKS